MQKSNTKFLILGGTGYIGSIIKQHITDAICFNSTQYNSNYIQCNYSLVNFIFKNNITHIIDLTINTTKQLITFYMLMRILPKKITYITLSSYSLIDPYIYGNDKDNIIDTFVSNNINIYLKKNVKKYYSFITPQITNDNNVIITDINALKTNYTYYCVKDTFVNFIFYTIFNCQYGIYTIPAIKFICTKK